jgi:UDP:flavonoid glycosyltransferase YjiC (YdhE family)
VSTFLLVTHGSDGDVLPFVRIGGELLDRGHRVTLITHAPYRPAAVARGLDFIPIDGIAGYEKMLTATPSLFGDQQLSWPDFYAGNQLFEQIRRECDVLMRLHRPGETVLVGRHTSAVSVRFVAEIVNAPVAWIAMSPTQVMVAPIAAHVYGTELAASLNRLRGDLGLQPLVDWQRWFTGATSEIGLWPAWFDEAGYRSPPRMALTGFPLADEYAPDDLPTQPYAPRTVLATGGTGRMLYAGYYPMLIAAAAQTGLPTILAVRHRDLLPAVLPPNVEWYPRLSFPRVMPDVAAVVHHGGIGTCVRALAAGTPQVLLPDGIDRPDNAARLAHHGLARFVEAADWDAEAIAAQIMAAVDDDDYRARAVAIAGAGSANGAAEAANQLESLSQRRDVMARLRALGSTDLDRLRAQLDRRIREAPEGSPPR